MSGLSRWELAKEDDTKEQESDGDDRLLYTWKDPQRRSFGCACARLHAR